MNNFKTILMTSVLTTLAAGNVYAAEEIKPSFDCAKAKTRVEKLICSDAELAKLDREMSSEYHSLVSDKTLDGELKEILKNNQKKWLDSREKTPCLENEDVSEQQKCIKNVYRIRIKEINDDKNDFAGTGRFTPVFDCSRAVLKSAKMACSDADVLQLNKKMDALYKKWLSVSKNKKAVIENQKKWKNNWFVHSTSCSLKIVSIGPDDPAAVLCAKRKLSDRIEFIENKINNKPITVSDDQIDLALTMRYVQDEFIQENGAINYKSYSKLPFTKKEQNLVCDAVKNGQYEDYVYRTTRKQQYLDISKEKFSKFINEDGSLTIDRTYYVDRDSLKFGNLKYSVYSGRYLFADEPLLFRTEAQDKGCRNKFIGIFYSQGIGKLEILRDSIYGVPGKIYDLECNGSQDFIIIDHKAYLVTKNADNKITQVDRIKSVECQRQGFVCDEQFFTMCKYNNEVK